MDWRQGAGNSATVIVLLSVQPSMLVEPDQQSSRRRHQPDTMSRDLSFSRQVHTDDFFVIPGKNVPVGKRRV